MDACLCSGSTFTSRQPAGFATKSIHPGPSPCGIFARRDSRSSVGGGTYVLLTRGVQAEPGSQVESRRPARSRRPSRGAIG
jgi:hypothetical protein